MISYVYCWRNKVNGKCYIGKGRGGRAFEHLKPSQANTQLFHRALAKYGQEAFELVYLEQGLTDAEALVREVYYIRTRQTRKPNGYNLTDGGEGTAGRVYSAETRAKISAANSGPNCKLSERMRGQKPNHKGFTGRTHSEETRAKISARGVGREKTPAQRAAISRRLKGHSVSQGTREKLRAAQIGQPRPHSPEHKRNLAEANRRRARAAKETV